MKKMTTATLVITIKSLNFADSLMPRMRMPEMMQMMIIASKLTVPGAGSKGEETMARGNLTPKESMMESKVADQLTATVAAPTAYSRTRAQPMSQAMSSPMVAYE